MDTPTQNWPADTFVLREFGLSSKTKYFTFLIKRAPKLGTVVVVVVVV